MIEVEGLCVSIGSVSILEGIALRVEAGTTVGVVGHNGAGKTTLMRALMGLLPARAGTVRLCGAEVSRAAVQARVRLGVGYMPEDRRLVPNLSVRDNILLPMEVARRADAAASLDRVLDWIPELRPLVGRQGSQLSGGQQKLAALARAICYGTRILLLDEPFEGVAPALVERLGLVLRAVGGTGATVLITDSEGENLRGLCAHRYEIERGALRPAPEEAAHARAHA
ncbi:ABC transporter ATP-binding protein [Muricoccus pecuniae]|uniref:Branched-chain amino acid transport system ATP-binding protein n=1 Tax=Muricoccus pecuniae TaxID=693023 RepID=A0A840Y8B1_9PROT|nr:ATP-binding cassette domain-containing protein [Roseomonas pecuniae]MBB5696386.1 branched-chain amino acid transport system ATP-binding protein [Roseomonas pecuniae]